MITKERVLEAAKGAKTVTDVARKLGLCGATLDGRTGRMLRSVCPGLGGLLEENSRKPSAGSRKPGSGKTYREGSVYAIIFAEGSRRYRTRQELVARVAAVTGQDPRRISYSLQVLLNRGHSSNGNRSTALLSGDGRRIKLIALRRQH